MAIRVFHCDEATVRLPMIARDARLVVWPGVGAISANIDPRESLLAPASDAQVRRLWRDSRVVSLADAGDAVFSSAAQGDLRGPLLLAGLLLALGEAALASLWRRQPQ